MAKEVEVKAAEEKAKETKEKKYSFGPRIDAKYVHMEGAEKARIDTKTFEGGKMEYKQYFMPKGYVKDGAEGAKYVVVPKDHKHGDISVKLPGAEKGTPVKDVNAMFNDMHTIAAKKQKAQDKAQDKGQEIEGR